MKLDKHVIDMFTELTKPSDDVKMEKTCYGTISVVDGTRYVKLDGSDLLVPAASTVKTSHGDRVTVLMKNHSLTVTGNLTAPATDGGGSSSGEAGTAATIEIGTVTTGEAGSSASVTNVGTKSEAIFDFVIPKGDKGDKGDTGPQGPQGEKGDTGTWDGTIPDHEHTVSDITDFPTSLPANGGNADTVGAKSISQILAVKGWFDGDMDNLKEQGSYIVNHATNMPIPGGWGTALVFIGGTGSVVQVFTAYVISASDLCKTYIRHFTGDLWSTWVNIADGGNADTLDGLHANEIASNPNLLDNPNFKINQRGLSVYSQSAKGAKMSIDRWAIYKHSSTKTGDVTLTPSSSGGLVLNNSTDGLACMYQRIENFSDLFGKQITYSASINGSVLSLTTTCTNATAQSGNIVFTDDKSAYLRIWVVLDTYVQFEIYLNAGKSITVDWAKVEMGGIATPFCPPNPATELEKCQRYYYSTYQGVPAGTPASYVNELVLNAISANRFNHTTIDFPTTMRTTPTVKFFDPYTGEEGYACMSGSTEKIPVNVLIAGQNRAAIGSSGLTVGTDYYLHYIASAEL